MHTRLFAEKKTYIMGILNVTPDSFSDGGKFFDKEKAVFYAKQMVEEGADCIDIGGESSRPGAVPVSTEEELQRVVPVIERLVKEITIPLSIDTTKPEVAEKACQLGIRIINDTTGFTNDDMLQIAKKYHATVVVMHKGKTTRVMEDIQLFLQTQTEKLTRAGITDIIIDPGIGFEKSVEDNLTILKRLHELTVLPYPILLGISKKAFLGKITGLPVEERVVASLAASMIGVYNGASMVRVHDIKETRRVLQVVDAIKQAN